MSSPQVYEAWEIIWSAKATVCRTWNTMIIAGWFLSWYFCMLWECYKFIKCIKFVTWKVPYCCSRRRGTEPTQNRQTFSPCLVLCDPLWHLRTLSSGKASPLRTLQLVPGFKKKLFQTKTSILVPLDPDPFQTSDLQEWKSIYLYCKSH